MKTYCALAGAIVLGSICFAAAPNPLVSDINHLKVASENNSGYARSKFPPQTVNHCSTRARVLRQENNRGKLRYKPGTCTVTSGRWLSPWDARWHTRASAVQVDHTVALAEAWGSGARSWSKAQRKAYANDLTHFWTLNTVTSSVNLKKSAKDVAQWMPAKNRCLYIKQVVSVKKQWKLSVDKKEKAALLKYAKGC